jgi:putative SOS response-associated peptidase YedK
MCNAFGFLDLGGGGFDWREFLRGSPRNYVGDLRRANPTDPVPVIRYLPVAEEVVEHEVAVLRWGLIPHWAAGVPTQLNTNARSETVATKPSFRDSYRERRCIIPAVEFYEFDEINRKKQMVTFRPQGKLTEFFFAGIWDSSSGPERTIQSCAMLTVPSNSVVYPVNDRMPLILEPEQAICWLDPKSTLEQLQTLIRPLADHLIKESSPPRPKPPDLFEDA